MNILGIIVEYNPFHNGHLFHLEQAKKLANADYVIAVMSGNFMQRGVPAFLDKWSRTKMALSCGVDMVIELPVTHASTSAENFAFGAISILENLKIVDSVCFGSELGNIETLKELSNILSNEPNSFKKHLKEHLDLGLTFPKARSNALYKYITENNLFSISNEHLENILNSPNNILGIEYLKALNKLHSNIVPYTITRKTAGYHDVEIHDSISSATAIRNSVDNLDLIKSSMPDAAFEILKEDLNELLHNHG